jgi:predicted small metal-binding protein
MIRRLCGVLLAIVLAVAFTTVSRAQDSTQQEPKKEGKMEMMKSEKEMGKGAMMKGEAMKGEMMKGSLYSVTCDPDCGFMVRSHDKKEISSIVIRHAMKAHKKKVTEQDVMGMMKTEEAAPSKE